jgi:hypothetical protein
MPVDPILALVVLAFVTGAGLGGALAALLVVLVAWGAWQTAMRKIDREVQERMSAIMDDIKRTRAADSAPDVSELLGALNMRNAKTRIAAESLVKEMHLDTAYAEHLSLNGHPDTPPQDWRKLKTKKGTNK